MKPWYSVVVFYSQLISSPWASRHHGIMVSYHATQLVHPLLTKFIVLVLFFRPGGLWPSPPSLLPRLACDSHLLRHRLARLARERPGEGKNKGQRSKGTRTKEQVMLSWKTQEHGFSSNQKVLLFLLPYSGSPRSSTSVAVSPSCWLPARRIWDMISAPSRSWGGSTRPPSPLNVYVDDIPFYFLSSLAQQLQQQQTQQPHHLLLPLWHLHSAPPPLCFSCCWFVSLFVPFFSSHPTDECYFSLF